MMTIIVFYCSLLREFHDISTINYLCIITYLDSHILVGELQQQGGMDGDWETRDSR